jgi:hypothetical protein
MFISVCTEEALFSPFTPSQRRGRLLLIEQVTCAWALSYLHLQPTRNITEGQPVADLTILDYCKASSISEILGTHPLTEA